MKDKFRQHISTKEAMELLGVSSTYRVWLYFKEGKLEGFKEPNRIRLYLDSVQKLARQRKELAEQGLLNINPRYHVKVLANRLKGIKSRSKPSKKAAAK